jgi:hypothetical protein
LEAYQQFSFLQVGLLAPRPTPMPEDQASVFVSPRGRVATHFSRLLRHAWVTVGLFLLPGHHTGNIIYYYKSNVGHSLFVKHFIILNLVPWIEFSISPQGLSEATITCEFEDYHKRK